MISRILVYSFHNELTNKSIDAFSYFYIYFGFVDSLERIISHCNLNTSYIINRDHSNDSETRGEKCRGLPIAAEWNSKWRITGTGGSARWGGGPIISSRCIIRSRLQSALDRAIWKFHLSFRAGVLRRCSDTFSLNRGLVSSRLAEAAECFRCTVCNYAPSTYSTNVSCTCRDYPI